MTDNEIIKAKSMLKKLEEAYEAHFDTSKHTPCDIDVTLRETAICLEKSLDEINRQKAEIERLNGCVKTEDEVRAIAKETIQAGIGIIKAEAIKEFAERLKTIVAIHHGEMKEFVKYPYIDDLVKEMVGDV